MNIALSAVIISILLIHPFVLYFSIYLGKYSKVIPKFSLFEALLGSAILALMMHGTAITLIDEEIRFDILIKVLGGELKNVEGSVKNDIFKRVLLDFSRYNLCMVSLMFILGRTLRKILQFRNFHAYSELYHLYHEWWYYFNGYSYEKDKIIKYDLVFIDVIVDTKNGRMFYDGYLVNFETIGRQLDRIKLVNVRRKKFDDFDQIYDDDINTSVRPIDGTTISIKYEDRSRLTVDFVLLADSPNQTRQIEQDLTPHSST